MPTAAAVSFHKNCYKCQRNKISDFDTIACFFRALFFSHSSAVPETTEKGTSSSSQAGRPTRNGNETSMPIRRSSEDDIFGNFSCDKW